MTARGLALLVTLTATSLAAPALAATAPSGFPFGDETLSYSIVWPSGLSLGEAHLQATHTGSAWNFDLKADASLPGYAIIDRYRATASSALCSSNFERDTIHGSKKASERIMISGSTATRQTVGGGKSEIPVSTCAHDALTFLFLVRRELGQGKIAPAETIVFGAGYPVKVEFAGQQQVRVADVPTDSDKVICTIQLPKTGDYKIEMFFARDAARTPLVLRAPFAIGTFAVELQR
jgi:hypothetical protein